MENLVEVYCIVDNPVKDIDGVGTLNFIWLSTKIWILNQTKYLMGL